MEDIEMEECMSYNPLFATIPIRALNLSCRRQLAFALNPKMPLPSACGYTRDWQGLVEAIGYPYEINKLLSNRDDPTMALLDIWEKHASNPTIANLLEFLQTIERFDVITDILPLLERDTKQYLKNVEEDKRLHEKPIQVPIVTSEKQTTSSPLFTTQEVCKTSSAPIEECISPEEEEYPYHAYVSYVDSDIEFVNKLIEKLEGEYRLRLFVKDRDMLAGFDEAAADVRMISERCKRILLILSPEFLSDPKCEFTTMFAQAMAVDNNLYARKVIPVICKPCELSIRLKYIARVDYTKRDIFGKFWERLFYSIKNPIMGELPIPTGSGTVLGRYSPNHLVSETGSVAPPSMDSTANGNSSSSGRSTESSNISSRSGRLSSNLTPLMDNATPIAAATANASLPKDSDSDIDSGARLAVGKQDKKKKSPLPRRRLGNLFSRKGNSNNNAQTQ